ncbi:hypothetical protein [Polaromonas sp. YR568]|uniref:hypothetical protein n=1 Tax=Polaromonas sp. YR568 TaxID=1855301 RepID=UPI003138182C
MVFSRDGACTSGAMGRLGKIQAKPDRLQRKVVTIGEQVMQIVSIAGRCGVSVQQL